MTMYFDPFALSLQASHRPTYAQGETISQESDNQEAGNMGYLKYLHAIVAA